jgi:hypothetical protein
MLNSLKDKYKSIKKSVFDKLDKIKSSNKSDKQKNKEIDKALKGVKPNIALDLKTSYTEEVTETKSTKTFLELMESESIADGEDIQILLAEQEIDKILEKIGPITEDNIDEFVNEVNEGLLGSIVGGLAGFALGKTAGKMIAKVLGVQKGIFYDMLTSRLVGAALGASLGKKI